MVFLARRMQPGILDGASFIITTSAASMAASDPSPPMAMPMSALAREGASLMPSPTKAVVLPFGHSAISLSSSAVLSPGRSSNTTSSIPSLPPTSLHMRSASPDSITVLSTSRALSPAMASSESSLTTSETTIWPRYLPSFATWTFVPAICSSQYGIP